jgi:hypothetical protein
MLPNIGEIIVAGFVVIYGNPQRNELESMFSKINHRGPQYQDIFASPPIMMAQNYLEADLTESPQNRGSLPTSRKTA